MFNIALNTFREIIRNKFFGLIAFLGIIFILLSMVLDTLALGEARRVLFDFGLSFVEITGFVIVLFLGGGMIAREIDGRTIYLMLSKPVRRGMIILGKFTGFSAVITLVLAVEMMILLGVLMLKGFAPDALFFYAIIGIWLKLEALLALILFFSTWVSPTVAMFMTITSYIIGHSGYTVLDYAISQQSMFSQVFARVLLATFPNLASLNLKNYVATDAPIALSSSFMAFWLVGLYIFCILYLSVYIFERKSFDTV
jgi:ABC-type transport system involved in multi-copper enzyme maturation permease subunit